MCPLATSLAEVANPVDGKLILREIREIRESDTDTSRRETAEKTEESSDEGEREAEKGKGGD